MTWGLLDTVDGVWMGNDDGPLVYEVEDIARVAAEMCDAMCGWPIGRARARPYEPSHKRLRDEQKAHMSPVEALRRLEEGEL
jgi:hypothetical protein